MKGEKEFFRKKLIGGFNREDVVKYLAKLAKERNEAIEAQEKAEDDAKEMAEEVKMLRDEIKNLKAEAAKKASMQATEKAVKKGALNKSDISTESTEKIAEAKGTSDTNAEKEMETVTEAVQSPPAPVAKVKPTAARVKIKARRRE